METLRLKISDLYRLSGQPLPSSPEPSDVLNLARRCFAFLPEPPVITLEDDTVVIQYKEQEKEGVDNPELLKSKEASADMYLLNALQRFDKLTVEQVRTIAFEIGFKAQQGISFDDPVPKYTLKSLPGEVFSGLQLMCLMYAGFQRFAPERDLGMDLHASFLRAVTLFLAVK
jgi:hypothetical protein